MQEVHRKAIQRNFVSLVETTDLDNMVTALYEKGVFSEQMIEEYKDTSVVHRERKRKLYLDIKRRGPHAFSKLLDVLKEHGYWDLVRDLDPDSSLHLRPTKKPVPNDNNYISLSVEKKKTKSECETPKTSPSPASGGNSTTTNNNEHAFVVKKSTKIIDDNESNDIIKSYQTSGKGVALMFTYVAFNNIESYRKGVDVDCQRLKHLFMELGFSVLAYVDLTLDETEKTLMMLKEVLVGCGSVFVVVSSHGHERARSSDTDVRCSDGGLLSLRHFVSYFSNRHLPLLQHVPKVFIFQMCRGENMEYVWSGASDSVPRPAPMPETDGTPVQPGSGSALAETRRFDPKRQALYSNILIAQSTLPGFVSHRDPVLGSWYIQVVCEVFAAHAHDTHVDELFTLVDKRLVERFEIQTSSVDRWGFNQRLYLHPGLRA